MGSSSGHRGRTGGGLYHRRGARGRLGLNRLTRGTRPLPSRKGVQLLGNDDAIAARKIGCRGGRLHRQDASARSGAPRAVGTAAAGSSGPIPRAAGGEVSSPALRASFSHREPVISRRPTPRGGEAGECCARGAGSRRPPAEARSPSLVLAHGRAPHPGARLPRGRVLQRWLRRSGSRRRDLPPLQRALRNGGAAGLAHPRAAWAHTRGRARSRRAVGTGRNRLLAIRRPPLRAARGTGPTRGIGTERGAAPTRARHRTAPPRR